MQYSISACRLNIIGVKIRDGLLGPKPRTIVEVVVERLVVTIGIVLPRHVWIAAGGVFLWHCMSSPTQSSPAVDEKVSPLAEEGRTWTFCWLAQSTTPFSTASVAMDDIPGIVLSSWTVHILLIYILVVLTMLTK